jgi:hypothetical protein
MNTQDLDPAVIALLKEAGWHPGRNSSGSISLPTDYEPFPVVQEVLRELGGLCVGRTGIGIDQATCTIDFTPSLAEGTATDVYQLAKVPIYPLGDLDGGNALIFIDDTECVYMLTDELEVIGRSISSALRSLLLGVRPDTST